MTHNIDVNSERFYFDVSIDRLKAFPDNSTDELWRLGHECSWLVEAFENVASALFDYERAELNLDELERVLAIIGDEHFSAARSGVYLDFDEMIYDRTGACGSAPWRIKGLRETGFIFSLVMFGNEVNRMADILHDDDFLGLRDEFSGRFPELKEIRDFFAHKDERLRREVRRKPAEIGPMVIISRSGSIEVTNSKGEQSQLEFDRSSIVFARDITICAMKKCGYEFTA